MSISHLSDDQLDLLCKTVSIAKQKLIDSMKHIPAESDRYRFNDREVDELGELYALLDDERTTRRKASIA